MRKLIFLQQKMISLAQGKIGMKGVSWRASVRMLIKPLRFWHHVWLRWRHGRTGENSLFSLPLFSFVLHLIFLRVLFLWSEMGLDIKEGSAHQSLLSSGATKIQTLIRSHVRVRVDEYSIFPLPFLFRALLRWFGLKAAEMRKGMRQRTEEGH